ncbi:MAG: homogentisate 1,2-dioxygenase [Phycisphaerae bacterium]|nr:homogentisate 1,2-dioxygenase [Phycisphaerae bacterium]
MPYYTQLGDIPAKRHIQFRRPDGGLYSEEVFGTEGFSGPTSTLYHIYPPTQVSGWKPMYSTNVEYVETDILRMRHLVSSRLTAHGDPVEGRRVILGNSDVEMSLCQPAKGMDYHFKNAHGDECLFIHFGSGTLHTMFGTLKFHARDFIVIPRGTIYRMVMDELPDDDRPAGVTRQEMPYGKFICFEAVNGSHVAPPPRYIAKKTAQFLEDAPYCERDLRVPKLPLTWDEQGSFEVRIKALNRVHSYHFDYHPLDVVGWDGCYYPYCFNADDFSPIVGMVHLPPPIHQVFEAHNFVICAFCPRPLDFHPKAIPIPYNHSNIDSDEVMYYVAGDYKARKGIGVGSISLHPLGIPHGPHPGTIEQSLDKKFTDELAVMCDTFRPLLPTRAAIELDDPHYPESWKGEHFPSLRGTGRAPAMHGHPMPVNR